MFASAFLPPGMTAQGRGTADVWLTTASKTSLFKKQPDGLRFGKQPSGITTIDVDDKTRFQQMDGFGFALTGGSAELLMKMDASARAAILKELFSTGGEGLGVSYLRVSIGASDMNERVFTYDDLAPGEKDLQLARFDLGPDKSDVVPVLQEILKLDPRIKILASPWTPPSWMKTNENPKGGSLKPEFYPVYAQYFVRYIKAMAAEGIPIDALTAQNEPLNPKNTPSLVMTAKEEGNFIADALGPALATAGLKTKIILYDHNCDRPDYPLDILADARASKYVTGSGFHLYEGEVDAMSKVHDAHPDKDLYFTEQMIVQKENETPFRIHESVNRTVIGATRNWSRNVLLWNLAADPSYGPHTNDGGCPVCQGAITIDGNDVSRNLAYYTMAHASRFVRPGSVRIGSNDGAADGLPNVAFETPEHEKVLIVANAAADGKSFSVRYRGRSFAAKLGAGDVATYVWR